MNDQKKSAELKNWHRYGKCLVGDVYGHPNFTDGTTVRTSDVIELNENEGIAETRNTIYRLREAIGGKEQ